MNSERTCFITGMTDGLGLAMAKQLLQEGWKVFGGGRRPERLAALQKEFPQSLFPLYLDVTDAASLLKAREAVEEETQALHMVINCAGIFRPECDAPLEDTDVEAALGVMDINAIGPMRVTKTFLPLLQKGQDPVLVHVSSESGSLTGNTQHHRYDYCMSKAALNMFTVLLRHDLPPMGIRVFAVHPGWMHTAMGGPQAPLSPEESAKGILSLAETMGRAEDPVFFDYDGSIHPL